MLWRRRGSKAGDGDVDDGSVGCSVAARVCSRLWTMTGGWRGGSGGCLRCAFVRGSGVGDAKDKRIKYAAGIDFGKICAVAVA